MLSWSLDGCLQQQDIKHSSTGSRKPHFDFKFKRLHFWNGYELRLYVARVLRVLHIHGFQGWNDGNEHKSVYICCAQQVPTAWLTLWRFRVVLPKGLVLGDVGVKEAQRVFGDVLSRHHLVGADNVGQRDGRQLLLRVRLHRVEDRLVCIQWVTYYTFKYYLYSGSYSLPIDNHEFILNGSYILLDTDLSNASMVPI